MHITPASSSSGSPAASPRTPDAAAARRSPQHRPSSSSSDPGTLRSLPVFGRVALETLFDVFMTKKILLFLSLASMVVAKLAALSQSKIKKLLLETPHAMSFRLLVACTKNDCWLPLDNAVG